MSVEQKKMSKEYVGISSSPINNPIDSYREFLMSIEGYLNEIIHCISFKLK